ncbi:PhzF family phenazine biosynthesis protein [Pseudoalteromonas sp. T1lg23B]|uniref:PhzF family phenazine biosynthesis protein n=1 Tax=Pseudoalteromonas sp. T1lg23B TaxID=2077097 RepID=UPI001319C40B|nr:PhzF family phenazine biosynthesis isomerase [Pseudoalteromonas sp. T1lg23B]
MSSSCHSELQVFHCNVFCAQPYRGNQATVVCCPEPLHELTMQLLAREFNTPETMFMVMSEEQVSLRYFTPLKEVNSCAHGTLAAASVAFTCGYNQTPTWVELTTNNGLIRCYQEEDEQGPYYAFFAQQPQCEVLTDCAQDVLDSLRVNSQAIRGAYLTHFAGAASRLLLHLDEAQLLQLSPDWQKLHEVQQQQNLTALFAFSWQPNHKQHLKGRMFSPLMGINEDPVNGNSVIAFSCVLTHLCQSHGQSMPEEIHAQQGFNFDRDGTVRVALSTPEAPHNSVRLAGQVIQLYHFTMDVK